MSNLYFDIRKERSFKRYPHLDEGVILQSMLDEIKYHNLPIEVVNILRGAWNSRFWVTKGYDGATIMGGYMSDYIFKEILKLTGSSRYRFTRDFIGTRIGWVLFFKWKHKINKNIVKPSFDMMELYVTLKK